MISLHEGRGSRRNRPAERIFQLHLKVLHCEPLIWRRILVRESMWLSRLHDTLQVIFDWYDYQTHVFGLGDLRLGNPSKTGGETVEDDRDITLAELNLDALGHFTYTYRFDEGWNVEIAVEHHLPLKKGTHYPRCTGGARCGPPEDCGGPEAYQDMLASLAEPDTDLGREWLEWLGPGYDAEDCNLVKINAALGKLAK